MTTTLERVLAVVNHPGGANAVVPVVQHLIHAGVPCGIMTVAERVPSLARLGLPAYEAPEPLVFDPRPDVLLLGTSVPDPRRPEGLEVQATIAARRDDIPTLAVLDYWAKYEGRFRLPGRTFEECLPDCIAVMDQRAADAMRGFPPGTVVVTGNPHWERLAQRHPPLTPGRRTELRARFGVGDGERLVLFISQALDSSLQLGALQALIGAVESLPGTIIGIRPHPREEIGTFTPFLSPRVRIIAGDESIYDAGRAADARVGIYSTTLFEYALLGLSAISYQPALLHPPPEGVTMVTTPEALRSSLFTAPAGRDEPVPDATRNVVRLLEQLRTRTVSVSGGQLR